MTTLLKTVARNSILREAWLNISHRPDSRGFDNITIENFEINLNQELHNIRGELLSEKYQFTPLKGVGIPKENTDKIRPLKIPAIRDRVVQKAIEIVISPYLKKIYKINNPASFAYIKKRSVEDAVLRIKSLHQEGYRWIYKADIEKFFDTVDINILLGKFIYPCLPDKSLNVLIKRALTVELGNGEILKELGIYDEFPASGSGIPQGGTLSPLFANVYLNSLDIKMIDGGYKLVRYADDFVVMCKSENEAKQADSLARSIIEEKLKLKIYPTKYIFSKTDEKSSYVIPFSTFEFLGIRFLGSRIYPGPKQFMKMIEKLKNQSRNSPDLRLISRLNYLKTRINSWGANYHYTDFDKALYNGLDSNLFECVNRIFFYCGYKYLSKMNSQENLNKIGLMTFTQSLNHYKSVMPLRRKE